MISIIYILHQYNNITFSKVFHEQHFCAALPADCLCRGAVSRLSQVIRRGTTVILELKQFSKLLF